jgi:hypothetical protein
MNAVRGRLGIGSVNYDNVISTEAHFHSQTAFLSLPSRLNYCQVWPLIYITSQYQKF